MSCPLCNPANEHLLYSNDLFRVILVNDIPGFLRIILNKHVKELSDLPKEEALLITKEIIRLEKALKKHIRPDKINVATLGNYVPHLHIHIIPRFINDPWWPDSIWLEKHRDYDYTFINTKGLIHELSSFK